MIRSILSIGQSMNYLLNTVLSDSYELITVEDVYLGMHLLRRKKDIDAVIVDIDYQNKEANDFILHLHSSKLYNQRIFALVSPHNFKVNEPLLRSCVHAYFIKPFNPVALVEAIEKTHTLILSPSLS